MVLGLSSQRATFAIVIASVYGAPMSESVSLAHLAVALALVWFREAPMPHAESSHGHQVCATLKASIRFVSQNSKSDSRRCHVPCCIANICSVPLCKVHRVNAIYGELVFCPLSSISSRTTLDRHLLTQRSSR